MKTLLEELVEEVKKELHVVIEVGNKDKIRMTKHILNLIKAKRKKEITVFPLGAPMEPVNSLREAVSIASIYERTPMMKTIYISGKVTGLEKEEYTALFEAAEKELKKAGYNPINPIKIKHLPGTEKWCDYMRGDIKVLCDCDGIYMLTNWKDSKGANVELAVANYLEMDVLHQHRMTRHE